ELNLLEREFLDASMVMKQRVEEEKRLHEAESERMKLFLEKRKRERIFGVTVFVLGLTILIAIAALSYGINLRRQLAEKIAADAEKARHSLVEKGQGLRDAAKRVLVNDTNDLIRDVTALRNLSPALNLRRTDAEAAKMVRDLL